MDPTGSPAGHYTMSPSEPNYKIKLASGRILGPLDLERVRLLILKNQIVGNEVAREYPRGDWKDINLIAPVADLLIARAEGKLNKEEPLPEKVAASWNSTFILPGATNVGSLHVETISGAGQVTRVADPHEKAPDKPQSDQPPPSSLPEEEKTAVGEVPEERTQVAGTQLADYDQESKKDKTSVSKKFAKKYADSLPVPLDTGGRDLRDPLSYVSTDIQAQRIANERTVMLEGKKRVSRIFGRNIDLKEFFKATVAAVLLGMVGLQILNTDDTPVKMPGRQEVVRPSLPTYTQGHANPELSGKLFTAALPDYLADTVLGYRKAVDKLQGSAGQDINNVRALALLASSYLNLIDSSNKDENYFAVISKLIEMSRAKSIDLPETVLADVEFYIMANRPEAAQNRIVDYSRTHPNFGVEMYYYMALAFFHRGDFASAARYLSQIPDNKVFSAKIFYLRGQIAEKLDDLDSALKEYERAVQYNKFHAKSRLAISELLNRRGRLKEAGIHLVFLTSNPLLLPPKDLAQAYYLHALLSEQSKENEVALGDAERAHVLDRDNHDYLLELYSLRAKGGENLAKVRKDARMYYFLGEGEKLLRVGKPQDALTQFLQARQSNNDSPVPLVKIGDMFSNLHDLGNARLNYRLAAERAPNNIEVWGKYIHVLIDSYEWDEAVKAMDRFRKLPVSQSAVDKAAGDMYAKQGRFPEAQLFYRKAMARESIDPEVYIAYARVLMAGHNYKEAPFFLALALRLDPLNVESIVSTAKCIAETDSIDRAINMLEDELQKGTASRGELLAAIAEFQMKKGDWEKAQQNVEQAMAANPDYAYPWKLQALIYMDQEGQKKDALDRALFAYQAYSERNSSDPSGYLERYKIFIKKGQYDLGAAELEKIYAIYTKYPKLHYYKGILYDKEGNARASKKEFEIELANNPGDPDAMIELGNEYIELGDAAGGLKYFNLAMRYAPRAAKPKGNSGWANYLLKNYAGAIALYKAAITIDAGDPLLYKRLGLAYRDMGDPTGACQAFRKYLEMEPDAPDKRAFQSCL